MRPTTCVPRSPAGTATLKGMAVADFLNTMLALLQQFTTLGLLATAVTCTTLLAVHGQYIGALVVFGLSIFAHAIILAIEFLMLVAANRDDPAPAATLRQLVKAWWGEVLTTPQVFCWQQPFRSTAQPDHVPPNAAGRPGIVFVHGLVCNRGLWNPWLARMHALDIPFVAVNLEPIFGSIEGYAPLIEQAVRRIESATATPPLIVAHSMGGLAVRAWLCAYQAAPRVRRVVTIGTPHRGTLLARLAMGLNGRQMRPTGEWLSALRRSEAGDPFNRFTCFYSHCDNIILPASSATLPGADNRHVEAVAHVHLARHDAVLYEVLRLALDPERRPESDMADPR